MSTAAISVKISGSSSSLKSASNEGANSLSKVGDKAKSVGKLMLGAFGAAGAIEAAKSIGEATEHDEVAQAKLATALKNTGTSYDAQARQIAAVDKAGTKLGYTNAQTKDALAALVTATGSSTKALKLLPLAQNVAAASGKDLSASAIAVAKASEGQTKPLRMLGIDLPVVAGGAAKLVAANKSLKTAQDALTIAHQNYTAAMNKGDAIIAHVNTLNLHGKALIEAKSKAEDQAATLQEAAGDKVTAAQKRVAAAQANVNSVAKSGDQIIGALGKKLGGQAAAQAETFGGKVKALKANLTNIEASVGEALIPRIEQLSSVVLAVVGWFQKGSTAAKAVEVGLGLLTAALIVNKVATIATAAWNATWAAGEAVVTAATGAATAAQWLFNAAMSANPIALVIIGIVALGAAVFEAYQHFGPFRTAVDAVWQALQTGYKWVKANWPLLLAILLGPIALATLAITKNWSTIKNGAEDAFNTVVGFVKGLPGRLLGYAATIGGAGLKLGAALLGGLVSGVEGVLNKVGDIGKAIANGAIRFVNIMLSDVRGGIRDLANVLADINIPGAGRAFDAASSALNGVANHIPNIPSFDTGGIVPGRTGAPMLAVVHGGENVQTPAQQAGGGGNMTVYMTFTNATLDPMAVTTALKTAARRNGWNFI